MTKAVRDPLSTLRQCTKNLSFSVIGTFITTRGSCSIGQSIRKCFIPKSKAS